MTTTNPAIPRSSSREDFWTEEASSTLIDAWGRRYLELNRGNLRQKDWQHVADLVNARHPKTFRTDVQCKNRVDTLKKKYKTEKAKAESPPSFTPSSWPFFNRLHHLVGPSSKPVVPTTPTVVVADVRSSSRSHSPPMAVPLPLGFRKSNVPLPTADLLHRSRVSPLPDADLMMRKQSLGVSEAELLPRSPALPPPEADLGARKRSLGEEELGVKKRAVVTDDSYFRRNYSAVAAAAAAAAEEEESEEEEDVESEEEEEGSGEERGDGEDGIRKLAGAIRRFGEVYERVEGEKQSQMIELEKERMKLAKELELQRMQMFINMQLQIKKIRMMNGTKRPDSGGSSAAAANGQTTS